jgi:serine/threonine-protein kinase
MDTDRWQRVEAIYHAASALSPAERTAYLHETCGADDELLQEVKSLLAEEEASSFLDRPPQVLAVPGATAGALPGTGARRVGNYLLFVQMGSGSAGEVYRALDAKRRREVVVRLLPQTFVADPQHLWQLQRDARVLAWLNHPHIGSIFGLKMFDARQHALILELIQGGTLAARIAAAPLPPPVALEYGRQIASALAAIHAQRVAHGRLRSTNVMFRADGVCRVVDFGIGPADRTAPGDIRDFARMLLEMLGAQPGAGTTPVTESALAALRANVRPSTARLLEACLDSSPDRRPQAADLLLELEEQRAR